MEDIKQRDYGEKLRALHFEIWLRNFLINSVLIGKF